MRKVVLFCVCMCLLACSSPYWQHRWLGKVPAEPVVRAGEGERVLVVPLRYGRGVSDVSCHGAVELAKALTARGVQAMAETGERVAPDPETHRLISELASSVDFSGTASAELAASVAELYNADRILFVDVFSYETYWQGVERRSRVGVRVLSLEVATGQMREVTRTGDGRGFGVAIRDVERRVIAELAEVLR